MRIHRIPRRARAACVALALATLAVAALVPNATAHRLDLSADIGVTQQTSTTQGGVGARLGFVVTIANHGPESAPSVKATDTIDGLFKIVSASPSQGKCFKAKRTYTCFLGRLDSGASATFTLIVVATGVGKVTNTVSGSSGLADPDTTNQTSTASIPVALVDASPPVGVAVHIGNGEVPPAFETGATFTVHWTGTDPETHVAGFDVRYRRAPFGSPFGDYVVWQPNVQGLTSAKFTDTPGSTYCFSARATNRAGTTSDWSAEACTAVPIGVRAFAPRAPWATKPGDGYYLGSFTIASKRGATLTRARLTARRLGILATRCHGCGTIAVRWNGRTLRSFSLGAASTQKSVLLQLPPFASAQRGTLTVSVLSDGKPVKIEGLAASQV